MLSRYKHVLFFRTQHLSPDISQVSVEKCLDIRLLDTKEIRKGGATSFL